MSFLPSLRPLYQLDVAGQWRHHRSRPDGAGHCAYHHVPNCVPMLLPSQCGILNYCAIAIVCVSLCEIEGRLTWHHRYVSTGDEDDGDDDVDDDEDDEDAGEDEEEDDLEENEDGEDEDEDADKADKRKAVDGKGRSRACRSSFTNMT